MAPHYPEMQRRCFGFGARTCYTFDGTHAATTGVTMAEQGSVELAADVLTVVQNAIASGQFASREEMISEALRQ